MIESLCASPKSIRKIICENSKGIHCIYLFALGKVKDLRKVLKIGKEYKDDDFVHK